MSYLFIVDYEGLVWKNVNSDTPAATQIKFREEISKEVVEYNTTESGTVEEIKEDTLARLLTGGEGQWRQEEGWWIYD